MSAYAVTSAETAVQDLLSSSHAMIYAYGVIAAYLVNPEDALDAMAQSRKKRDQLINWCEDNGIAPSPARAAYELPSRVTNDVSARVNAAILEERACAHWATAIFYLPSELAISESNYLQDCAARFFNWSGIAKAFSSR